jgi:hypothetical protein
MSRDVIVVGAGGGGPVVAKELASRGLDVLLLEAGPYFTDPERQWSHFANDAGNPLTGYFRFGPGDRSKPAWFRETPQNSLLVQVAGVGGTTLHYYANCPRAMPGAFAGYDRADASAYDAEHRFPFPYAELVPYYEWAEATLPVQTAAMGTKEEIFFRGAEAVGLPLGSSKDVTGDQFRPQENAILQPGGTAGMVTAAVEEADTLQFPKAWGCTFCGSCHLGCMHPHGAPLNLVAKRSTYVSYVPMALTADRWAPRGRPVTLVPDAFATRVVTAGDAGEVVARAVTWRDTRTGEFHTVEARVVVLAAGATETPRLWLNSGLPNPNGWVGRGLTNHPHDLVTGVFPFETGSMKGAASAARVDYPGLGGMENVGFPPAVQALVMQFSDSGIRGAYTNGRGPTGPWDGPAGRLTGLELKDVLADLDRLLNVMPIADDDVEAQNRVTLSAMSADEHGPVAKVEVHGRSRSARTLRNREALAWRAAELLRAAGATRVYRIDWPMLILHIHSTMRMGGSRRYRGSPGGTSGTARPRALPAGPADHARTSRVMISGPGPVAAEIESYLHPSVQRRLAGRLHLPLTAHASEVAAVVLDVQRNLERRAEQELVEQLRQLTAADRGGVVGLLPTMEALQDRRIGTLVVSRGFEAPGGRCPSCGWAGPGPRTCPRCHARLDDVEDIVELAIDEALAQKADVVVCDETELDRFGRIGAIERF